MTILLSIVTYVAPLSLPNRPDRKYPHNFRMTKNMESLKGEMENKTYDANKVVLLRLTPIASVEIKLSTPCAFIQLRLEEMEDRWAVSPQLPHLHLTWGESGTQTEFNREKM